jgi:sigma-E factor negative regulatory protein RseA
MNNEELDSQLSAMFDDELPAPECELLARRLARDEGLKARWGRYATIGACIRMERGGQGAGLGDGAPAGEGATAGRRSRASDIQLHGDLAARVSRMVAAEPALLAGGASERRAQRLAGPASHWWMPVAGGAVVAAGVAAAAILWLRAGSPDAPIVASTAERAVTSLARPAPGVLQASLPVRTARPVAAASSPVNAAGGDSADEPDSYVVPPAVDSPAYAPPMELANFVVAHSEYSMPLLRGSVLSSLVTDDSGAGEAAQSSRAAPRARARAGNPEGSRTPHVESAR